MSTNDDVLKENFRQFRMKHERYIADSINSAISNISLPSGDTNNYFSERVTLAGGFNANDVRSNMQNATLSVQNSTLTGSSTVQGNTFFDGVVSFDDNIYLYNQGQETKKNATVRADEATITGNPHFTGDPDFVYSKFTRDVYFNDGDNTSTVKGATVDFDRASLKGNPTITGNPTLTANPVFAGNPKFNNHVFFYTEQQDDSEMSTVKGATVHLTNSTIAGAKASIDVNHANINANYSNATARYSTIDVRYASIQGGSGNSQAASISGNVVFTGTPNFTNGATGLSLGSGFSFEITGDDLVLTDLAGKKFKLSTKKFPVFTYHGVEYDATEQLNDNWYVGNAWHPAELGDFKQHVNTGGNLSGTYYVYLDGNWCELPNFSEANPPTVTYRGVAYNGFNYDSNSVVFPQESSEYTLYAQVGDVLCYGNPDESGSKYYFYDGSYWQPIEDFSGADPPAFHYLGITDNVGSDTVTLPFEGTTVIANELDLVKYVENLSIGVPNGYFFWDGSQFRKLDNIYSEDNPPTFNYIGYASLDGNSPIVTFENGREVTATVGTIIRELEYNGSGNYSYSNYYYFWTGFEWKRLTNF